MAASTPPIFDVHYNRDTGKYDGVDIHAELQKLQGLAWGGGGGGYETVEMERAEFADSKGYLLYDVRVDDMIVVAHTTLRDDLYDRPDLAQILSQPITVRVMATPQADVGQGGMPRVIQPIVEICQVRFEPVPYLAKLVSPTADELPIPAVADRRVPVTLQVFEGIKGPPAQGVQVTLRPASRSGRYLGAWEPSPPAGTTDQNGEVSFVYAPPDLWYRSGGEYTEEVIASTGQGGNQSEILRFALPLAPRIQFRLASEKVRELELGKLGIELEPSEVSISADERVKAIDALLRVQGRGSSNRRNAAVALAPLTIELFDGRDYAPFTHGGRIMETDNSGRYLWSMPELTKAYGSQGGETYRLDPELNNLDYSQLNAQAAKVLEGYEHAVFKYCPFEVLSADLGTRLREYPDEYCGQLAARATDDYERIVAASETLRFAAGYAHCYQDFYQIGQGRITDDLKNVFNEALGLAINMVQLGDKLRDASAWVVRFVEDRRWVQRGLEWFQSTIVANLRRAARILLDLAQRAGSYVSPHFRQALRSLNNMVSRTVDEMGSPGATVRELVTQIMGWIGDLLRAMANALIAILAAVLDALVRCLSGLLETLGINLENINSVAYQYAADAFRRAFHLEGPQGFTLSKLYEYLSGALSGALSDFAQEGMGILVTGALQGPGALVATLLAKLNWLGPLANYLVGDVHTAATELKAPLDYEERTSYYRDLTNTVRGVQHSVISAMHEIDEGLAWLDMLLLAGQVLLAVIVTVCSWGAGAAIMTQMTAVDVAWSKIKLYSVRFPQLATSLGFQLTILTIFALGNYQLLA